MHRVAEERDVEQLRAHAHQRSCVLPAVPDVGVGVVQEAVDATVPVGETCCCEWLLGVKRETRSCGLYWCETCGCERLPAGRAHALWRDGQHRRGRYEEVAVEVAVHSEVAPHAVPRPGGDEEQHAGQGRREGVEGLVSLCVKRVAVSGC